MRSSEVARYVTTETPVAVGNASAAFVAASAIRMALYLPASKTVDITYSTLATAVLYQGITVFAGGAGVWLNFDDFGPVVGGAWNAIASAVGPTTVNTIEVKRAE